MSTYETKTLDFIHILETRPELFSTEDRADLKNLVATLPDDVEEIANAIAIWCGERQPIDHAIMELPTGEAPWRAFQGKPTKIKASEFKKAIQNGVRQSKPASNSPKK